MCYVNMYKNCRCRVCGKWFYENEKQNEELFEMPENQVNKCLNSHESKILNILNLKIKRNNDNIIIEDNIWTPELDYLRSKNQFFLKKKNIHIILKKFLNLVFESTENLNKILLSDEKIKLVVLILKFFYFFIMRNTDNSLLIFQGI